MDKLDQLLTAYVGGCIEDEAAHFLSLDVSGIEYNETIKRSIMNLGNRPRRERGKHASVRIILVACLVALSLIFTACMAIPEIRAALWRIVLEPHEDHIAIRFEQETSEATTAAAQTKTSTAAETEPYEPTDTPQTLEQFAYITDLPTGYTILSESSTKSVRIIDYGDASGKLQWRMSQSVIHPDGWALDYGEGDVLTHITVTTYPAILIEYPERDGFYSLTWRDDLYFYNLYGYFSSSDDIARVAESVKLRGTVETTEQQMTAAPPTTVAEATPTPPKAIEQIAFVDQLPDGWYNDPTTVSSRYAGTDYRDANGNFRFYLAQSVLSVDHYLDSENQTMTKTTVRGYPALLMKDTEEQNVYTLTWTDELYAYNLYGLFDSINQLMRFAEAVKLKEIPIQTTAAQTATAASQTTVAAAIPAPPKKIEQYAYVGHLPNGWYSESVARNRTCAVVNYFDKTGDLKFVLTQLLLSGNNRFDSEDVTITQTTVRGYPALLMNDTVEQSHTLTWTDGLYNYTLYGIFDSINQLMRFAEAVKLQ